MTLFEECVEALGDSSKVLTMQETNSFFKIFTSKFPFAVWGRIEWDKIERRISIEAVSEIVKVLKNQCKDGDSPVYILWDEATLPSMKTSLNTVINVINDVTAVSFDTWIFCPDLGYVIEFYHENEITLGLI